MFFFNDTATTEIYTLSLHDALPIFSQNLELLAQSAPFLRALLNSIFVVGITTASTVLLSALAGYAFAKFRFRGRGLMFAVVLGTLMLPTEIMVVPLFIIMLDRKSTRLNSSHANISYAVFCLK